MYRFAGFELDQLPAELRGADGGWIKLRPKTLEMLLLFAANAGRVLSKQELMEAVWPNLHVGEDSLFQCIREIRTALGDDRRQTIRLVSGRGYIFAAEVTVAPDGPAAAARIASAGAAPAPGVESGAATGSAGLWRRFGRLRLATGALALGLCAMIGFAAAVPSFRAGLIFDRRPPSVAVMPIVDASNDDRGAGMASAVTDRLIEGLARIDNIRVVVAPAETAATRVKSAAARSEPARFVVQGELQKAQQSWTLRARLVSTATREVLSVVTVSVGLDDGDALLRQSRLAAGAGDPLARRLNALVESGAGPDAIDSRPAGGARVAIEQATASINQTTRERFGMAQTMLEKALDAEPDNVDLQVALAGLRLRGIQMAWYEPAERAAAEHSARSLLERASRARPRAIAVLEADCRLLNATNQFVESLVSCARALSFDPWNGLALFHIGVGQIQLGRFEDALATFTQADRFDTPEVSRWTWLLGAGWASLLLDRDEDAVRWLQRSIAITPASGRSHMLLAVAYQRLGRPDDAKAALAKAMATRPGSTARNVELPKLNASRAFLDQSRRILATLVEIGLPEG